MRGLKSVLFVVVMMALAAYAIDCGAVTAPDQAMECCKSMPCHSHGQDSGDCCKAMTAQHAPFLPAISSQAISLQPIAASAVAAVGARPTAASYARTVASLSHAPPFPSSIGSFPLRI
jgi:hypothetical protein